MTTKILSSQEHPGLQPALGLWSLYQPEKAPFRFQARTEEEAQIWQATIRPRLAQTIGFQDLPPAPLEPSLVETVDKDDYTREKWLIHTWGETVMPVYILIPKGKPPFPAVLAFHGHGYGVKDIVGLQEDGSERDASEGYQKDFAVALCRAGFLVAAPEISCFGERQTDFSYLNADFGQPYPETCAHTAFFAFTLGGSALGLRVYDARRLVDYLETRPDADTSRLGAMGISGGGMLTFFAACLDERIRACVVSGYFSTFRESILAMQHCACNFVPGLHAFGEMYDLAGLVAPRPMLVEAGSFDPIFPIEAVRRSVEITRNQIYAAFSSQARVETDYFEGIHQISGAKAYAFLQGQLK